jgi:beta-glucanase (GH16 family)
MRKPQLLSYCLIAILGISACSEKNEQEGLAQNIPTTANKANAALPGICEYDLNDSLVLAQGYRKVFEENFSTDLSKWNQWNSGAYNEELQLYKPANLQLSAGKLIIKAKKETVRGATDPDNSTQKTFNYTSGRIEGKFNFAASDTTPKVRISARMKVAPGYGMWPAFWTYGGEWPTHGELDIMESIGQYPSEYSTNYWYGSTPGTPDHDWDKGYTWVQSAANLTTCYHVYEAIWQKDTVTFLFDGAVVSRLVSSSPAGELIPKFFGKAHHVTLNAAIGGTHFGPDFDPSRIVVGDTYVDWVRVYTSK